MKKYFPLFIIFVFSLNVFFAETIEFSAGYMTGQTGKTNSVTVLEEDAYIKTASMEINANKVELSGKDFRYIKATGNVTGKNTESEMDFSCNDLEYDRETKKAVLKGSVSFIDTANDVKAKSEVIEYNEKDQIAIFQINVNIEQKDNTCIGSYCVYYKDKQLLEISGNAQVRQKDDLFRAQHITLDIETQEVSLDGNVKGAVKSTNSKSNSEVSDNSKGNSKDNKDNKDTESRITPPIENKKTENKKETPDSGFKDDTLKNTTANNNSSGKYSVLEERDTEGKTTNYDILETVNSKNVNISDNSYNNVIKKNDVKDVKKEEPKNVSPVPEKSEPVLKKDEDKTDKSNEGEEQTGNIYPEIKATKKKAARRKKPSRNNNVIINDNRNKNNLKQFMDGE